jgi:glutamate-1-semialdehyde 2,1-aminomutase
MAAGLTTLRELTLPLYDRLETVGAALEAGLREAAAAADCAVRINRVASLLTLFFDDDARFARFFHAMLDAGVLLPPSQQEAWFLSAAHGEAEIAATLRAARGAFDAAR